MKKQCPNCCREFEISEAFTGPKLKERPKWFEASHKNPETKCPNCRINLKPNIKSLWPALFVIPGILPAIFLPTPFGELSTFTIAGISIFLAILSMKYEVRDL